MKIQDIKNPTEKELAELNEKIENLTKMEISHMESDNEDIFERYYRKGLSQLENLKYQIKINANPKFNVGDRVIVDDIDLFGQTGTVIHQMMIDIVLVKLDNDEFNQFSQYLAYDNEGKQHEVKAKHNIVNQLRLKLTDNPKPVKERMYTKEEVISAFRGGREIGAMDVTHPKLTKIMNAKLWINQNLK